MLSTLPIFSIGFRVFFLLATLIAILNPSLWLTTYLGELSLPLLNTSDLFWHAHEMIFGFTGALIAGFILTASPSWTGTTPYRGASLVALALIWLLERVSYFLFIDKYSFIIFLNLFYPTLTFMLFIKLKSHPKQRNVFIPILLGITLGKVLHSFGHLFSHEDFELAGRHIAIALIRFIVLLIAGRVLPFFTRMKMPELEILLPKWIHLAALLPLLILVIPLHGTLPSWILTIVYLWAIIANAIRQGMCMPHKTIHVPIIFILHVGITLILISLIQESIGLYYEQMHYTQSALHMLMAGGLSIVAIGIMNRVSLGHTGRVIKSDCWTISAYTFIFIGASLRSITPILFSDRLYLASLPFAGIFWVLGFTIFLLRFSRILCTPRPDGKPF